MNQELKNLQQKYSINLFDWYYFKSKSTGNEEDSKILILGDVDDNFIFPISKRVAQLTIAIESKDIERIIDYLSLPTNVNVIKDFVENEFGEKQDNKELLRNALKGKEFDYIVIPSMTTRIANFIGSDLKGNIEKLLSEYTNNKGTVLLAFDNRDSFNAIAGKKIDDEEQTYSYEDILMAKKDLAKKYPHSEVKLYYPMPEYKFPLRIYSDKYLPLLEDENEMTRNLVRLNMFEKYCYSYIMIFDAEKTKIKDNEKETIYVKYNLNRTKKYALCTSMVCDNKGAKTIIKKAIHKDANEHIAKMVANIDILKNKNVEVLRPIEYVNEESSPDGKAYVVFPFIEGRMYTEVLLEKIRNGEKEKEVILEGIIKMIGKLDGIIENYNLDCTFQNAMVKDDKIIIIDSEWVFKDTTEVDFLKYRILKYFYNSCRQYLSYRTFNDLIRDFRIDYIDSERYENAENDFQTLVHGNINNLDINKYEELNPSIEKFYFLKSELEKVRDALDKITGDNNVVDYQTNKQNEIIRLTNVHVNNLETMIRNLKEQVLALSVQSTELFRREGVTYKFIRKLKNFIKKNFPPETVRNKILKYIYRTIRHPFKMLKTYLTSRGRNRIIGDFMIGDAYFECGKVALPKCDFPLVSIIIPCYNQIKYTYKCLYSIMQNTDPIVIPYEVIIADDVSTDTTRNIKKYVENVIVNRNKENLGFLKNCNEAAKLAKGKYIFFLNNDTEVRPNYLTSLVELIEKDNTIGMVGSKLIFANGTLQEAGGIIWSDGQGANYGRGQNPGDFRYNYIKEVDYISGAAIMIRKSLWDIIGGFDERYAPAYCEDSDLAFEVRKFGYKVVYQPKSEIIHYEGISCGTDTNDGDSIKSYQVANTEKLKEKWSNELLYHFPHQESPNFFKARERAMDKKVILFIDHYVPTWDKDAGSKTVFSYMMMFKNKGYSVKFLGDNYSLNSPYGEELQQMGIEVLYGNELQSSIWEYLNENKRNIDYIFLNRPHIAIKYIDFIRQNMYSKIIYYGHDLHYMRLKREYDISGDYVALNESKYYRNIEYSLLFKADMSYYPSYIEIEEIRKTDSSLHVKAINAYIYEEKDVIIRDFSKTQDLLFVGGFAHLPNVDAIKWLHESIMPRIRAKNPGININVVGSNPTDEVKRICEEGGYNLLGYVSDEELTRLYKDTRVVVAPLRYGAGIKGKIVEAMANGAAIITTSCGAEGIKDASYFMKIEDDAHDFAQEVLNMYGDFEKLKYLSLEAQKVINHKFTMDAAWNIIKDDF